MSEDAARIVAHFLEKVEDAGEVNFEKEVPFLESRLELEQPKMKAVKINGSISFINDTKHDDDVQGTTKIHNEYEYEEYKDTEDSTMDHASQIFDYAEKKTSQSQETTTQSTSESNRKLEIYKGDSKEEEVSKIINKIVDKSKKERLQAKDKDKSKTSLNILTKGFSFLILVKPRNTQKPTLKSRKMVTQNLK